jgi:addiction module HigA family antidote
MIASYTPPTECPVVLALESSDPFVDASSGVNATIRTEVIEALGLSVSKAAEILQVRRATLSDLLHGKAALTPEIALRIEKAFGPDMEQASALKCGYPRRK